MGMALALILALTGSIACGSEKDATRSASEQHDAGRDEHEEESEEDAPAAVALTAEQRSAAGIEVVEVGPGAIDSGIELLGEVHPNGDRLAHITPRYPGIVREVRRNAGDLVAAGDVLAVIESSGTLAPYSMQTLIAGVILAKRLTIGEAIDQERQAFVVADLSRVWIDLAVYQNALGRVAMGQRVRIQSVNEGPDAEGEISYLTPSVDQVTRTATARVVLDNPQRKFLPGMFVTAYTMEPDVAALAVPRDAIQPFNGRPCVFVETPTGFVPRFVSLGREGKSRVEVVAGLAHGERIAAKNTFLLKAELEKAEAEEED